MEILRIGTGFIGATTLVGAFPNMSGTEGETNVRADFSEGMGNMGKSLPVMGKVKGTGMVMKSLKKLKPIKFKGGYKL